ncbi:unnamed protein product [Heligmosomoides polygyrus]|uniref:Uncharacterized protein n=1 Tax=Heligmosomoides polygyrus TaxID=6339 RepID=A0A183GGY3_HELPZ|nr:unnamed protein product [Heligmosomoides polygyrus]
MFMRSDKFQLPNFVLTKRTPNASVSESRNQHGQRANAGPGQQDTGGLRSFQERRRSEKEEERSTPGPPIRLHCSSCPNIRLRDLGYTKLRAHLFDSTVLPALTYASETWAIRKQHEHAISVAQRGIERALLGVIRLTQSERKPLEFRASPTFEDQ